MRTSVAAVSEDTELWNTMPKKSIAINELPPATAAILQPQLNNRNK
ncbi:hypothetical protein [Bacteroides clarus]